MKIVDYKYQFVEEIPTTLPEGILFVSTEYATAVHLCACGCGVKVVTPLAPAEWSMNFNGVAVGLAPSIGNWSFPCRSHYWIKNGRVLWSAQWSERQVQASRESDQLLRPPVPKTTGTRRRPLFGWFRSPRR